ncbi:hypothetical protein BGW41_001172 [Actinomortierella wolfii]|nr:hypothetical protein BGW41_001172 [Actinomortierella wolfii]
MVSVVDKKPKTLYEVPKASKTGKAVAKNAAGVEYSTVSGPGGHVGTYNVNAAVSKPTRRRESTDLLEDTIRHPEVPLSAAYQTKSSLWGSLFGKKSKPEKKTEEKPKVTFSEVQGPVTTTTGDNSNNYNNNNNGGNHGSRGIEQQQQTQVDNQNMTLQPQMQPNNAYNYNTGAYNPYGYYPPGPAQESYILVGVDNQGSAPRENVMPQSQVAVQPTSTYTAQGPAPVTVPMDTSMPSTSGPTDTMVTTTPNVSETQGATGETGTTPAATTKGSKKLMGTSMSKLFGRRSGEHSDPIKDSNTDGLTPATTATVTAV